MIGMHFTPPGVTPDASKQATWRRVAAWAYAGIEAATVIAVVGPPGIYNFNTPATAGYEFNDPSIGTFNFDTPATGEYD